LFVKGDCLLKLVTVVELRDLWNIEGMQVKKTEKEKNTKGRSNVLGVEDERVYIAMVRR